jgi:hypothetical protein
MTRPRENTCSFWNRGPAPTVACRSFRTYNSESVI